MEGEEALQLEDFISNVATPLLQRLKFTHPLASDSIDTYFFNSDYNDPAHKHRKFLEQSMQTINIAINQYLDLFSNELQQIYTCYFEKFRTDGVDYDIYIGQLLAPDKPFDLLYVKNLRLWQLKSMAAVAKLTHSLLPLLPIQLQTTQLIFTHPNTIDISFRYDERRFDVKGAYNIRYQVIKKRIDKATIKNTDEHLTQVGKIAIIYFNQKDADEYIQFIQYLQQENLHEDDIEELELENLQGISGLKALRISVKL
ncbi:hypothetical protein [Solitalea lacus]|uniref:hypothetical protein n=1 Tax=Solitalea lacus TaxID=2911172 RepID=UPI001EDC300E|nr:hypothetical protein [Solitalea lacus]UKJ06053.1 hypothetical protein L2B55_10895 [Solitalea lacus]